MSASDEPTQPHSVLADAQDLLDLDPARAELWVSGLLADLDEAEFDEIVAVLETAVVERKSEAPAARLLAAVIAVVAEPALAERALAVCRPTDLASPAWASMLGTASPVDAMAVVVEGVRRSIIVRFAHHNDDRHLMLVELDDDAVTDLRFAPDGLFDEELGDESIELVPVPLDGLGATLGKALEPADLDTPSIALNRLVARRRIEALGAHLPEAADPTASPETQADAAANPGDIVDDELEWQAEGDASAIELLESALAKQLAAPGPGDAMFEEIAGRLRNGGSEKAADSAADIEAVSATAGLSGDEPAETFVLRFVSAYAVPRRLDLFTAEERDAIRHLEWADWLGALIGLTRAGEGTVVSPQGMVKAINRCPEITTTIPKADAEYVAWSFELTLHAWGLAGVIDDEERLTEFGAAVLPRAFRAAWQGRG